MTQRSIQAGESPNVIIRGGGSIHVQGREGDRVEAIASGRWGLKVERRGAAVEVRAGGDVQVSVPFASLLDVSAGRDITVERVQTVARASAGRDMRLDCDAVQGERVKFEAGRNLRYNVPDGSGVHFSIHDLGGEWEAAFGDGRMAIRLNAGGDVTLVAGQEPGRVSEIFGRIETPQPQGDAIA